MKFYHATRVVPVFPRVTGYDEVLRDYPNVKSLLVMIGPSIPCALWIASKPF